MVFALAMAMSERSEQEAQLSQRDMHEMPRDAGNFAVTQNQSKSGCVR